MKKSRFTETQIVKAIKAHEAGRKVEEICREMETIQSSIEVFYARRSQIAKVPVQDLYRLV